MNRLGGSTLNNSFWTKLLGSSEEFSMRNRAFNFVCVVTSFLLIFCFAFDFYIGQIYMSVVIIILILLLFVIYYFSRYKKKYKAGVVIFAIVCYLVLILNYFWNSGLEGPTLMYFVLTFLFLIILSDSKLHYLWIVSHIATVISLLFIEYYNPDLLPTTYETRLDRFLDIGVGYVIAVIFIYALFTYLRDFYNAKRLVADERAIAISAKNKQILAQNQQLEKLNEEKNKLFSIVSHDLKAPLDSIRGYLELLSGNLLDEGDKEKIEEELLIQTKYTSDLLFNLMSWAKAQMHGVVVNLAPHNVQNMIDEIASNKKPAAARKGIKLTYSIDPALEVVCDKDMMHIIMRNLINNAIKFTNDGGEVYIKAAKKTDNLVLSVTDTGIGIPTENRDEIFTLKTRSTYGTNQEKGIGLGLMMCKEFIEYQHGEIWFESKYGIGTTFFVSLPLTRL
jgi:signal transduction histidine kinase